MNETPANVTVLEPMTLQEASNVALGVLDLMDGDQEGFSEDQRLAVAKLIVTANKVLEAAS